MNTCGFWWNVLWSERISLCKKLKIIYNIITHNPTDPSFEPVQTEASETVHNSGTDL